MTSAGATGVEAPPRPPSRWAGRIRPSRAVPLAVVGLVAVAAAAVVPQLGPDRPGRGEAFVTVHGSALVTRADGATAVVVDQTKLEPGDRIDLRTGWAALELADGVAYEARAAEGVQEATRLVMGNRPELQKGALLVTADHGAVVRAARTDVRLQGPGAMRLTRTLATGVGVYRGRVQVDSVGATGRVDALRSMEVPAPGEVPRRSRPLTYSASDRWDRRFLADALAADRELRPLLAGFRAAGGRADQVAQDVRAELPDPPSSSSLARMLKGRQDADGKLVGTAIAGLARGGSFAERWSQVFAFRDDGAPWGLVAMDRAVTADDLVDTLSRAFDGSDFAFADQGEVRADGDRVDEAPEGTTPGRDGAGGTTPGGATTEGGTGGGTGATPGGGGTGGGPGVTVPGVTVPGGGSGPTLPVTVPTITVPGSTPAVSTPPVSVGPVTVPSITVPPVTVPITVGPISIPPVTLPPLTLPPITLPILGG